MPEVIEARRQALNPGVTEANNSLTGYSNKDLKSEQSSTNGNPIKFEPNNNQKQLDLNCNTPIKNNESSAEVTSNDNNSKNIPTNVDLNMGSVNSINEESSNLKTTNNINYNANLNSNVKDNKNMNSKSLTGLNSDITGKKIEFLVLNLIQY